MSPRAFDVHALSRGPIVAAPMGGGPTTPDLVAAVVEAGGLGFLAAGYKSVEAMSDEIATVRARAGAGFGVNVFVPQPRADPVVVERYVKTLAVDAGRLDTELGEASWDDDSFDAKVEYLLADPVPIVSFTFGCPDREVVEAFQHVGTAVAITITSPDEAAIAAAAGADCLCVQGTEAGAHQGTFVNADAAGQDFGVLALLSEIPRVCDLPMIAAGGIGGPRGVAAVLAAAPSPRKQARRSCGVPRAVPTPPIEPPSPIRATP